MSSTYIDINGLQRFKEQITGETDRKLARYKDKGGEKPRVLHHRMISYYSPSGEVYAVVKRMRIPDVKPGQRFDLTGIVGDRWDERDILSGTGIRQDEVCIVPHYDNGGAAGRYLEYDPKSHTLTAKPEIEELCEAGGEGRVVTVTIPTYVRPLNSNADGSRDDSSRKMHGGFTKRNEDGVRRLIEMKEDCVRPVTPRNILGKVGHNISQRVYLSDVPTVEDLQKRGMEVEVLRCVRNTPVSRRYENESGYFITDKHRCSDVLATIRYDGGVDDLADIDINKYRGGYKDNYLRHAVRWAKTGGMHRWRWVRATKWPDSNPVAGYYVRVRNTRGTWKAPWQVYWVVTDSRGDVIVIYYGKEPARVRLNL